MSLRTNACFSQRLGRGDPYVVARPANNGRDWRAATRPPLSHVNFFPASHTSAEVSMIGKTERELTDAKMRWDVGIAKYDDSAKGKSRRVRP